MEAVFFWVEAEAVAVEAEALKQFRFQKPATQNYGYNLKEKEVAINKMNADLVWNYPELIENPTLLNK